MQKDYLLLRNNQQTGPYNIEELLQLNLKPFDLIWVQGKSAAWQYPGEIASLQPYVPQTPRPETPFAPITTSAMEQNVTQQEALTPKQEATPAKHVFVRMPQKTRKPVPPVQEPLPVQQTTEPVPTIHEEDFSFAWQKKQEDTITSKYKASEEEGWNPRFKKQNKTSFAKKDLAITALIIILIAGGYYILTKPALITKASPAQMARKIEQPVASPVTNLSSSQQTKDNNSASITAPDPLATSGIAATTKKESSKSPSKTLETKSKAVITTSSQSKPSATRTWERKEERKDNAAPVAEVKQMPSTEATGTPQKKKLGEVLKNIFAKKNKKETEVKDPTVLEEPKPATNRQSTKRGEDDPSVSRPQQSGSKDVEEAAAPSLADQIELSSNAPESWMMGVSGLKITLRNRSNATVQTAAVTVLYYDQDNRLLDKKLIYFSNVPPKGKLTLPAPDHKFADHVEYKLGAVSAKEDRYANSTSHSDQ